MLPYVFLRPPPTPDTKLAHSIFIFYEQCKTVPNGRAGRGAERLARSSPETPPYLRHGYQNTVGLELGAGSTVGLGLRPPLTPLG